MLSERNQLVRVYNEALFQLRLPANEYENQVRTRIIDSLETPHDGTLWSPAEILQQPLHAKEIIWPFPCLSHARACDIIRSGLFLPHLTLTVKTLNLKDLPVIRSRETHLFEKLLPAPQLPKEKFSDIQAVKTLFNALPPEEKQENEEARGTYAVACEMYRRHLARCYTVITAYWAAGEWSRIEGMLSFCRTPYENGTCLYELEPTIFAEEPHQKEGHYTIRLLTNPE